MMVNFVYFNPNPESKLVGDCVVRAIAALLDKTWEQVYDELCECGRAMYDMPSSNEVWTEYLYANGFTRKIIPDTCPMCYSIRGFCKDNPEGEFLLATGTHVVTVIDGKYYDTWDSGSEVPIYYFKRRNQR
jgi:hypothetical protein